MAKKLPKVIYIAIMEEGTQDEYFMASVDFEDFASIGNKNKIGIYELKQTKFVRADAILTDD